MCAQRSIARATPKRVAFESCLEDLVHVAIQDDGMGFNVSHETDGLGIVGMEERVDDLGGSVRVTSEPHLGTLLLAEIPRQKSS
jgi:signal transduction histidine kinase